VPLSLAEPFEFGLAGVVPAPQMQTAQTGLGLYETARGHPTQGSAEDGVIRVGQIDVDGELRSHRLGQPLRPRLAGRRGQPVKDSLAHKAARVGQNPQSPTPAAGPPRRCGCRS
jgi:hypothetical protein